MNIKHYMNINAKIASFIKHLGMVERTIIVDKNGLIIVGNYLYNAMKSGLEIKILDLDLNEEQAKIYRSIHNKLKQNDWDIDFVIDDLDGLPLHMLELVFDKYFIDK